MKKTLIILRGAPGSGKSTFAQRLIDQFKAKGCTAESFESDNFFLDKDGNYNWDPLKLGIAHKWCRESVDKAMKRGVDAVIVANTNIRKRDVDTYIGIGKDNGYDEVQIFRLTNKFDNVHRVPAETVQRMRDGIEPVENETIICEQRKSEMPSDGKMLKRVLLDMDGVLCNFDKMADEHNMRKENGKCDWKKIQKEMGSGFWSMMEWTEHGQDLLNRVHSFCHEHNLKLGILSAIFLDCGKRGKMKWLAEHCPQIDSDEILITDKGVNKFKLMLDGDLLIDDKNENLFEIPARTFGIHYQGDVEAVMKELELAISLKHE